MRNTTKGNKKPCTRTLGALGFAILLLVMALPARADDDFAISLLLGKPGRLSRALGLDASQVASFRSMAAAANAVAKPLLKANAALLGQIQGELGAAAPDACTIGQQVATRHQNWLVAKAAYLKFDHDFSALLTPDQLARYEALKAAIDAGDETVPGSEGIYG
jgi:hypothetical protein